MSRTSPTIQLTCPTDTSETGAYQLSWRAPAPDAAAPSAPAALDAKDAGAVLEYRVTEDGQVVYQGPDTATTLTGRTAGSYIYVVAAGDARSEPCTVDVQPPPLGLAFGLFTVGLVVFVATLAVIVHGNRATARDA